MNISKFFKPDGRINRAKYFFIPLISWAIITVLYLLWNLIDSSIIPFLIILSTLGKVYIDICITIQRLHDIGRPGEHILLLFIPLYNIYIALILLFEKGLPAPNEYGKAPLEI
ncbi:DUF805 domain-containing protein [Sporosalibacterium faouarense]|uniref:DUF805 domain-containing protein n=1 Tax=Sporosalibacterium faouarense TaxID=516123 RepID=UPI00141C22F3|nr:DUF805 domain-containing protein [Sporosalibacterium faouarense]MTI49569.1 DUF805 domain-containing protein [Bacillota bacterium]